MANPVVYRCADGHLYSASPIKASLLSVHLGVGRHLQRCPVDRRWRTAVRIPARDLTDAARSEASAHRF